MMQNLIKNKVTEIIRDVLDDETIVLTRETTAQDVEDWDSLAHINIIVAIEKEFSIKFDLAELKPIKNVGELLDVIERKTAPMLEVFDPALLSAQPQMHV